MPGFLNQSLQAEEWDLLLNPKVAQFAHLEDEGTRGDASAQLQAFPVP